MVPVLDYLFSGKNILRREMTGAAMAVAGVALLESGGMSSSASSGGGGVMGTGLSYGDAFSLIQPLAFGLGFWKMEGAMRSYPAEAARMTASQIFACSLSAIVFAALTYVRPELSTMTLTLTSAAPDMNQIMTWITDPSILGALFWTGVITTALTVYMETLALETLSAAETTMIFSTEPLWGAAFASVVVGETFGREAALGAGLILMGCIYSNVGTPDWFNGDQGGEEDADDVGGCGGNDGGEVSSSKEAVVDAEVIVVVEEGAAGEYMTSEVEKERTTTVTI